MRRSVCNACASNAGRSLCVQISRERSYPSQYIDTTRKAVDCATTLPLRVFIQWNFSADFSSFIVEIVQKTTNLGTLSPLSHLYCPKNISLTFPAYGGDLEFFMGGRTGVSPDHTLSFCLQIKVMNPCLIMHYYPVEKKLWLVCKQQRRAVQTLTRFCFCSYVNILVTQRVDIFFMPKSSDIIRCTVVAWMSVVSAICRIVRRLSSFSMSWTIWTFSVLAVSLDVSHLWTQLASFSLHYMQGHCHPV